MRKCRHQGVTERREDEKRRGRKVCTLDEENKNTSG
jgi:hypothetical protein